MKSTSGVCTGMYGYVQVYKFVKKNLDMKKGTISNLHLLCHWLQAYQSLCCFVVALVENDLISTKAVVQASFPFKTFEDLLALNYEYLLMNYEND